ncbi:Histone-lysine N-methyltransferase SUVR5 [Platanthera guangdongensis]|uniref:Histone-lysine N-methyltransferase SUVR5 n=1 Tax=Platanthera guangdongensis TaxID=2320717 RepID=A0ABR2M588_9ASPA
MERKNLQSDVFSNMEANFPNENLCMVGVGNIKRKNLHFLFDSGSDKRGRCEGEGGRQESNDDLSDLGNDVIVLEDDDQNEINQCKGSMAAVSNDNCILSDTSSSHSEDYGLHRGLYDPTEVACIEGFGRHNLTAEHTNNNIQRMKENVQDVDPKSLANVYLDEHQTLPLWVKWRGKWQTGFRCPTIDCPVATLRAKPTHERKKYISIFFPRTRTYSWADMQLVCAIDEFPEPLAYGTHRRWRKLVKDLSTPRRYIMQKLAVAMLNISDQLHTEAVIVDARRTTTWKEFAMEASRCRDYPSLGLMLLKLQRMILPHYISKGWLENSSESWVQRCCNAPSTESIETLTEELVESVLWGKVDELWNAPVQPELGPEWKTWKQEAMKWFFAPHLRASVQVAEHSNPHTSLIGEPQTSRKRVKLEIRRPETSASQIEITDCRRPSHAESLGNNYGHGALEGLFKLPLNCESQKAVVLPRVTEVAGSGSMFDQGNEAALVGKGVGLESTVSAATDGIGCNEQILPFPDQSNSNRYRQCLAFIEAKGRQCGRWANDGDIYCCVHLTFHSVGKHPQGDHMLPIEAQMCHGTTTHGNKCKHRARYNLTFCKKHWFQGNHNSMSADTLLLSSAETSQRIQRENQVPEKLSTSNASSGQELILLREAAHSAVEKLIPITVDTLNERNCLMRQSEHCSTRPKGISSNVQRCIGQFGHTNGGQCYEFPRRHTLYCEKHLPRFLKRARNGKSRLISKDVFVNLLRSCSGEQKIYLHQACELLYGFLKNSLSGQKFLSKGDNVAWILAEASKDVNVGEYLLKLVCCEREKITGLWGFNCDLDKQVSSKEINSLSTMNQDFPMTQKCKICAKEFSDDPMLVRHWTEVHKKETRRLFKGYACAVCMNLFTNRKVLETHVIEKHGVQFLEHSILVRCLTCSSHFASPEKLWQHVFSFHVTELRLPNFNPHNYSLLDDNSAQMKVRTTIKLCQNKSVLRKGDDSQKYTCRFCGLKFDLRPDLGRHQQVAHMIPYSANRFSSKRGNYFLKRTKAIHSRFWKKMGSAFRFKNQSARVILENFPSSSSVSHVKPELYQQPSEVFRFGGLSQSNCCNVAETLFSKIQRTIRRPTTLEILSFARFACCRISLDASLALEYGVLPENIYLKAAKLCSELNIQVSWHQDGFTCPRGCKPAVKSYSFAPLKPLPSLSSEPPRIDSRVDIKWEIDECHYILSAEHFDWKQRRHSIVLCEDVSFGKEATPVACVVDEDLKHLLTVDVHEDSSAQKSGLSMPWLGYTYATERLMDPSLDLDAKSSQLGCACPQPKCHPEKCDHVYLFDDDYDNAVDIHGILMQGRFPYDDHGRILLEEGYLVYECNSMCSCDVTCSNRVLQKGVQVKLQVFRKEANKGWGVRAGEFIPGGTFICEYIGVVKARQETPGEMHDEHGSNYIYDMGTHSVGEPSYLIDATKYGNVSRFINHSCSPNLVNHQVLIESMDSQLAHVGLFAKTNISIGEELVYDYSRRVIAR